MVAAAAAAAAAAMGEEPLEVCLKLEPVEARPKASTSAAAQSRWCHYYF